MTHSDPPPSPIVHTKNGLLLDARTRLRIGMQLQALYEPVPEETLDPRLAELIHQLEQDRGASQGSSA